MFRTDIPQEALASLATLAVKTKTQKITAVNFVPPLINPWDYDPQVVRDTVAATIDKAEKADERNGRVVGRRVRGIRHRHRLDQAQEAGGHGAPGHRPGRQHQRPREHLLGRLTASGPARACTIPRIGTPLWNTAHRARPPPCPGPTQAQRGGPHLQRRGLPRLVPGVPRRPDLHATSRSCSSTTGRPTAPASSPRTSPAGRENWRVLHVENGGLGRARNIGLDARERRLRDVRRLRRRRPARRLRADDARHRGQRQRHRQRWRAALRRRPHPTLGPAPAGGPGDADRHARARDAVAALRHHRLEQDLPPRPSSSTTGSASPRASTTRTSRSPCRRTSWPARSTSSRSPVYLWRERQTAEQSITQRRAESRNLVDRMAAVSSVNDFLERTGRGRGQAPARPQGPHPRHAAVPRRPPRGRRGVRRHPRAGVPRVPRRTSTPPSSRACPPRRRLAYHLISAGRTAELVEAHQLQLRDPKPQVVRRGVRLFVRLPYFGDAAVGVPDAVYDVTRSQRLVTGIRDVRWNGSTPRGRRPRLHRRRARRRSRHARSTGSSCASSAPRPSVAPSGPAGCAAPTSPVGRGSAPSTTTAPASSPASRRPSSSCPRARTPSSTSSWPRSPLPRPDVGPSSAAPSTRGPFTRRGAGRPAASSSCRATAARRCGSPPAARRPSCATWRSTARRCVLSLRAAPGRQLPDA